MGVTQFPDLNYQGPASTITIDDDLIEEYKSKLAEEEKKEDIR